MALELDTIISVGEVRVANINELKEELKLALEEFKSMPISRENIHNLKSARARLNKASDSFNKRRIELGKVFSKPFETFKSEVNSIISMIEEVSKPIDDEIKKIESIEDDEKRVKIYDIFLDGYRDSKVPYERYWDDKYLNKSMTLDQIRMDIQNKFNEWHNTLVLIDRMDMPHDDKLELKANYLITLDINKSLEYIQERAELLNRLNKDKRDEGEVVFQVIGSYEELKKLSNFLKENKYNYKRLK